MLNFASDLLLLAVDANHGAVGCPTGQLPEALAAALLTDLAFHGHIRFVSGRVVAQADRPASPILANALCLIQRAAKPKPASHWLQVLPRSLDLPHSLVLAMARGGRLRHEHQRVLGIFSRERYPVTSSNEVLMLRQRVHRCLESHCGDPAAEALAALAVASGLMRSGRRNALLQAHPACQALHKLTEDNAAAAAAVVLIAAGD
jgi:hypothetical protein